MRMNIQVIFVIWFAIGFTSAMILELIQMRKLDSFDENWYSLEDYHWIIICYLEPFLDLDRN